MGLVRDWRRQMARATGVSLIAPLALLVAALVVGAGGGLGGVGSLTQIAVGPSLPETDLAVAPQADSLGSANVVALRLPPRGRGAAPDAGAVSVAAVPAAPISPSTGSRPEVLAALPQDQPGASISPLPPSPPALPPNPAQAPPPPPTPAPTPPPPPPPRDPVGELLDTTRDLTETLPGGLGPLTGDLLDLLEPRP